MTRNRPAARPQPQAFAIPACLAAITLSGLIAGLVGDGGWDLAAAFGLSAPLLAIGLRLASRRPARYPRRQQSGVKR